MGVSLNHPYREKKSLFSTLILRTSDQMRPLHKHGKCFYGKVDSGKKVGRLPSPQYTGQPFKNKTNLTWSHLFVRLSVPRCKKQQLLLFFRHNKLSINYALRSCKAPERKPDFEKCGQCMHCPFCLKESINNSHTILAMCPWPRL